MALVPIFPKPEVDSYFVKVTGKYKRLQPLFLSMIVGPASQLFPNLGAGSFLTSTSTPHIGRSLVCDLIFVISF